MSKNQVAAISVLRFTATGSVKFDTTVFNSPFSRNFVFSITTPSVKRLTIKDRDVTVFINRQFQTIRFGCFQ